MRERPSRWRPSLRGAGWHLLILAGVCSPAGAATTDAQLIEQGRELYRQHCETCHGADMVTTSKLVFDLRQFPKTAHDRFRESVLNGKGGMPAWRDTLGDEDVASLWAYVRSAGRE